MITFLNEMFWKIMKYAQIQNECSISKNIYGTCGNNVTDRHN